ncbi:hypothetical protein Tco_1039923, partial [Tanacetum coccineum]
PNIGSLRVMVYGYDGLPMHLPSPDYVPRPEHPPLPVYVPYVPEPPLPADVLPTADSPRYIANFDPEDLGVDPEEDPADYPIDGGDDDDDDDDESSDDESSNDDEDDNDDVEEDEEEEEEEEHLALADFVPPPAYRTTARMSIRAQTPTPFLSEAEVDRLLAIPTPPSSPLTPFSSLLHQIPLPPLPVSSPLPISPPPLPASPTHPLSYRVAMIWFRAELPSTSHLLPLPSPIVLPHTRASMAMMRAAAPSTYCLAPRLETPPSGTPSILPIPFPTSSPPLLLPSTDYRADVPEVGESSSAPTARSTRGFKAYYGFAGTLDVKIRRNPNREIGYGITDIWVDPNEITEEIPGTDVAELGQRMTDFVMTVRQDTDEIYERLDDAQDDRLLMSSVRPIRCEVMVIKTLEPCISLVYVLGNSIMLIGPSYGL